MALVTRKVRKQLKHLNEFLTCSLCNGYLIDATTLIECLHVFCRGCILRHFEQTNKSCCPFCNTIYKKKNDQFYFLRADHQLQSIVYKLVPNLYARETQRRHDFYKTTNTTRASSSCSDDSLLDTAELQYDVINNNGGGCNDDVIKQHFFSPDDHISLSLEYYQAHLDNTSAVKETRKTIDIRQGQMNGEQRYLQCPAAVTMKHLQKFVRMKYALTLDHRVDIIYQGEVLSSGFTLMDVAYTFKWKRQKPLRFFYRIFTPLKIQPIKIINQSVVLNGGTDDNNKRHNMTSSSETDKRLLIKTENDTVNKEKEHLLANLQLMQSKNKTTTVPEQKKIIITSSSMTSPDCIFEYEEPDKEEIKRFAEIRDREWALQKKLDETQQQLRHHYSNNNNSDYHHHFSKKRKKNKQKRKLHAEITNEEELKLKVKLTTTPSNNNGHKHKHHKSTIDTNSSKEKLLQMRQIRHKHVPTSDVIGDPAKHCDMQLMLPTVQIERNEEMEEQVAKNKSFLEKFTKNKLLEKKIANLQQRCTIVEKKPTPPPPLTTTSFTVSKIEPSPPNGGLKRKSDDVIDTSSKRPSLEITLINPPPPVKSGGGVKRPPPPTIPLERIKNSVNFKGGISIVAKQPQAAAQDKCDNIGALDLSKAGGAKVDEKPNGCRPPSTVKTNLTNLQMLSKVATDKLLTTTKTTTTKQMPPLQTLKIPPNPPVLVNNNNNKTIPNLTKLPKLQEINKQQFRLNLHTHIRNLRPSSVNHQNQNIRNIPNPSLLIRQQNQNRLNSINLISNNNNNNNNTSGGGGKEKQVNNEPSVKQVVVGEKTDMTCKTEIK